MGSNSGLVLLLLGIGALYLASKPGTAGTSPYMVYGDGQTPVSPISTVTQTVVSQGGLSDYWQGRRRYPPSRLTQPTVFREALKGGKIITVVPRAGGSPMIYNAPETRAGKPLIVPYQRVLVR